MNSLGTVFDNHVSQKPRIQCTSGHPEVMIYGFPSSEKQTVIIDRIRRRKQDLQIIQPVTVTFRAYPIKVIKPNGEEANGKYAPDSVIRAVTL